MRIAIGIAATFLVIGASGQEILWERTGQSGVSVMPNHAKFIGDVDADGFDDLVTHAWGAPTHTNQLWLLSGRDGRTLRTVPWPTGVVPYNYDAGGDLDGDGTPDYVYTWWDIGSPWLSYIEARSGRDDRVILRIVDPSGRGADGPPADVLGGRDLNGDGRHDLVALCRQPAVGVVAAFDHQGRLLYRHVGTTQTFLVGSGQAGNSMGWVGDVDRDGADDFTLGSYDTTLGRYVALVLSGRTGQELVKGLGANPTESIGWCADGCGDVDKDGVPDFVAGSGLWPTWNEQGQVHVFSGRTGQTLRSWIGNGAGRAVRGGGLDFDRDGVPDIVSLYGHFQAGTAGVHVFSGRDSAWTHRMLRCPSSYGTSRSCVYTSEATSIDVGRPQPGNPYPVFVFNETGYGPLGLPVGRLRMYRGTPPGVDPFGTACSGTLPGAPRMGLRDLQGSGVRLHLSDAPPAAHVALLLGFSRTQWHGLALPASLAPLGLPGCSLYTSVELFAKTWTGTAGLDRGYAAIDLPLPLRVPGQETFTLHGQWLVLDAITGGSAVTDAVLWRH